MPTSPWSVRLTLCGLAAATAWLTFETRGQAEQIGLAERRAVFAERRVAVLERALADAQRVAASQGAPPAESPADPTAEMAVEMSDYARLVLDLEAARIERDALRQLLAQRDLELERRDREAEQSDRLGHGPMPEGVRSCLATLQDCLRAEGYVRQRFLRARALDERALLDVELLDLHEDGLETAFLRAARLTADLDREAGLLELRFEDGHRTVGGERTAFGDDGFVLRFPEVDGRVLEQRLPYFVQAHGEYPAELRDERDRPDPHALDATQRRRWQERFDVLLDDAGQELRWRVHRLEGLHDGVFRGVQLVGIDTGNLIRESAAGATMAVEIDRRAGVVSLLLRNGVLLRQGGRSTISPDGYRMLLPNRTPDEAIDAMLGMIVER